MTILAKQAHCCSRKVQFPEMTESSPQIRVRLLSPESAQDDLAVDQIAQLINTAYRVGEEGMWTSGTPRTTQKEVEVLVRVG